MGHPKQKIATSRAIKELLAKYEKDISASLLKSTIARGLKDHVERQSSITDLANELIPESAAPSRSEMESRLPADIPCYANPVRIRIFTRRIMTIYQHDHDGQEDLCQELKRVLHDLRHYLNKSFLSFTMKLHLRTMAKVRHQQIPMRRLHQRVHQVVKRFDPYLVDEFVIAQGSFSELSRADQQNHVNLLYRSIFNVHRKDVLKKQHYNGRSLAGDALLHRGMMKLVIADLNDSVLRQITRMDKVELKALLTEFEKQEYDSLKPVVGNITFEEQILIYFCYLALGFTMKELSFLVGRGTFTCSTIVSTIMPLMIHFAEQQIPPMDSEISKTSREGGDGDRYHFDPYIFGGVLEADETPSVYIDGTIIPVDIQGEERASYRNHKGTVGFNVLVGVDKNLRVQFVHSGAQARAHDCAVYDVAQTRGLLKLEGSESVIGDAAFPTDATCASPFKLVNAHFMEIRAQKKVSLRCAYNFVHDLKRNKVERLFGVTKGKFRVLKKGINVRRHADVIVYSVFALHNFLLSVPGNYKQDLIDLSRLRAEERALRAPALRPTPEDLLALEAFATKRPPTGAILAMGPRNPFQTIEEREQSIHQDLWDPEFIFPDVTEESNPMRSLASFEKSTTTDEYLEDLLQQYGSLATDLKRDIRSTIASRHIRKLLSVASRRRFIQAHHVLIVEDMIKVTRGIINSRLYKQLKDTGEFSFSKLPKESFTRYGKVLREFRALLSWYYFLLTVMYKDLSVVLAV